MVTLLESYSVGQILFFIVILAIALKEFFVLMDWIKDRLRKSFIKEDKFNALEAKDKEQDTQIEKIIVLQQETQQNIEVILNKLQLLMESDKDAIKTFITKEHHHFCYEQGWIDDYNLDCLERRFKHYKEENGNSFVESLMEEIRTLPRQSLLNSQGE